MIERTTVAQTRAVYGCSDAPHLVFFRPILLVVIGWLGVLRVLSAQDTSALHAGARVRLTTETGRFVGTLQSRANDSVTILDASRNAVLVVAMGTVRRLEVSRGERSRTGRGALIGLVSGTAAGVLAGLVLCGGNRCSSSGGEFGGLITLVLGGTGAAAGTGVGALVGSRIRSERWEQAPLSRLHIQLMRQRSGDLGVGLRLVWSRTPEVIAKRSGPCLSC
jgi:hypothetical protein